MIETIQILKVERDGDDGLVVTFADGTSAGYLSHELLELRPHREPTDLQGARKGAAVVVSNAKLHKKVGNR
jgi:hypothetical protein